MGGCERLGHEMIMYIGATAREIAAELQVPQDMCLGVTRGNLLPNMGISGRNHYNRIGEIPYREKGDLM